MEKPSTCSNFLLLQHTGVEFGINDGILTLMYQSQIFGFTTPPPKKKQNKTKKANQRKIKLTVCSLHFLSLYLSNSLTFLTQGERALFLESHRHCIAWIDEWYGVSMQQMDELVQQKDSTLNEVRRFQTS